MRRGPLAGQLEGAGGSSGSLESLATPPSVLPTTTMNKSSSSSSLRSLGRANPRISSRCCQKSRLTRLMRCCLFALIGLVLVGSLYSTFRILGSTNPCEVARHSLPRFQNSSMLPRVIHHLWPANEPMPRNVDRRFRRWKELFPDVEQRLWSDEDVRNLVVNDFPFFLGTFDSYPYNIMRVDVARTFILSKHGGLYVDMDYEPLVNFWDLLPGDRPALIESFWSHEDYQNSFMSSPPGHELWNATWQVFMERAGEDIAGHVGDTPYKTGPIALDEAVRRLASKGGSIHKLPCENFHRVSIGQQKNERDAITRLWEFYFTKIFKPCGSTWDPRCQFGIHHSRTMWG